MSMSSSLLATVGAVMMVCSRSLVPNALDCIESRGTKYAVAEGSTELFVACNAAVCPSKMIVP